MTYDDDSECLSTRSMAPMFRPVEGWDGDGREVFGDGDWRLYDTEQMPDGSVLVWFRENGSGEVRVMRV